MRMPCWRRALPDRAFPSRALRPTRTTRSASSHLWRTASRPTRSSHLWTIPSAPATPLGRPVLTSSTWTPTSSSLRGLATHVRRLDAQLEHDPALLPGYIRLLTLQGRLTSRLSRLLRERQQIRQAEGQDLLQQAMNDALDQASEILGVQL